MRSPTFKTLLQLVLTTRSFFVSNDYRFSFSLQSMFHALSLKTALIHENEVSPLKYRIYLQVIHPTQPRFARLGGEGSRSKGTSGRFAAAWTMLVPCFAAFTVCLD